VNVAGFFAGAEGPEYDAFIAAARADSSNRWFTVIGEAAAKAKVARRLLPPRSAREGRGVSD
jgi:hypothetical protein